MAGIASIVYRFSPHSNISLLLHKFSANGSSKVFHFCAKITKYGFQQMKGIIFIVNKYCVVEYEKER